MIGEGALPRALSIQPSNRFDDDYVCELIP